MGPYSIPPLHVYSGKEPASILETQKTQMSSRIAADRLGMPKRLEQMELLHEVEHVKITPAPARLQTLEKEMCQ